MTRGLCLAVGCMAALLLVSAALAAPPPPQPSPSAPAIEAPRDIPYPGAIRLAVDATDLAHAIFAVHETLPVAAPGPITLLYPQWIPGHHAPRGPIDMLGGLVITANGQKLEWRRDPVNVYAFHVDVPAGVGALDLDFQFLSPVSPREGRVMMTPDMLNVQWDTVALYPAGYFSRQITVQPSLKLPVGFTAATALETASTDAGIINYKPTDFETLVDSPLIAGRYFKRFDLDPGGPARVSLDVVADTARQLEAKPEQIEAHRALVKQAAKLFASRHYDHYDFLFSMSEQLGGIGLEHQQSSEDGVMGSYFTHWDANAAVRGILPHEYTHSWNGKFRRPAGLWTANLDQPMRGGLLWVYEGQTQYWGVVLAARSGLVGKADTLDTLAMTAATYDARVGRTWRALEDTTADPVVTARRPLPWLSWQRNEDYYWEGLLVWMDADTLIRDLSHGRKSLDDFAKAFFGVDSGSHQVETYGFDDVVAVLNTVQSYDWAGFLHSRVDGHGPGAPLDGLARGGYRLAFDSTESDYLKGLASLHHATDLTFSIGLTLSSDGTIAQVQWDGPAFKAGLAEGGQIVAVNGSAYNAQDLKDAITAATASGAAPIALLIKAKDQYRTVSVGYHGGLRYPHLERIAGTPARLDDVLAPRK